ncbi:MAG: hypothetical protein AMJ46_11835 [Latescibacteria bacterium DG_63]|nr:MAG: hypothetical protein AMJ46_11835 [Latescibacteria bacterium DG_63]
MKRSAIVAVLSVAILVGLVSSARGIETEGVYVDRERDIYHHSPLVIDVWTDKGEGAVYYPGERIRVYFRASRDCYVTLYNIDTQGYVHLLYPSRPFESHFIMGGVTYRIPSRRDPFDLTVGGLHGVEYVEAVASVEPFHSRLPWYLDPEYGDWGDWGEDPWTLFGEDYEYYAEDYDYFIDRGMVRGDPFLGIQSINQRMVPSDYPSWYYATAYTSFYVGRRVAYPRYLCYDCHWHHPRFDPYGMGCLVFDIRIDRTWVYSPRLVIRDYRPRYYYHIKDTAPLKYKGSRHFWSSKDGLRRLKKEFAPVKPETGPPKFNIPDSGKQKYLKDWGPSRLKQWKPGKSPSTEKVESLRKKLESQGVLKAKRYKETPKQKAEPARPKKEVRPKQEVKPKQSKTPKKEVAPSKQKDTKGTSSKSSTKPQLKQTSKPEQNSKSKLEPASKPKEPNAGKEVKKVEARTKQKKEEVKNSNKAKNVKKPEKTNKVKKTNDVKESKKEKTRKA